LSWPFWPFSKANSFDATFGGFIQHFILKLNRPGLLGIFIPTPQDMAATTLPHLRNVQSSEHLLSILSAACPSPSEYLEVKFFDSTEQEEAFKPC